MIPALPSLSASTIVSSVELSREFFISLGAPGLLVLGFLEFFFFPIPPMLVLIPLTVASPELALVYAAAATVGPVVRRSGPSGGGSDTTTPSDAGRKARSVARRAVESR
jgi:hypothetical protein